MFEKFKEWLENRHKYAKEWKEKTGGKVIGYFCTYLPEEIMYAGNILPVRILGAHKPQTITEPYIFGMYCPFCRDCLAQGLSGKYDYLDGIAIAQSCLHIRQAFTSWKLHLPIDYSYYLLMPSKVQSSHAYTYLANELASFKASLEKWLGKTISSEALDKAIEVYNKNRKLLKKLYELRQNEPPKLTGLEAMVTVVSSQLVDKEEHNKILEKLLEELSGREKPDTKGERLMIVGSEDDDTKFVEMVESLGSVFVIDDHCTGSRYFWNTVEPQEDRLRAIAARYLERPPCPSKDWETRRRISHILKLAQDYKVKGAILIQQKFCDPHELDNPTIALKLKEIGIPSLVLEFDVTVPVGQFKVRAEAFLEMIREEDLF